MERNEKKGLICGIYESKDIGNCSNNGMSAKYKDVLLIFDEEEAQIFEESEDRPTVKIMKKYIGGQEYIYAVPINPPKKGMVGYIMGGCFIYTSDSRFRRYVSPYPVPLHDRTETPEEYEMLSR